MYGLLGVDPLLRLGGLPVLEPAVGVGDDPAVERVGAATVRVAGGAPGGASRAAAAPATVRREWEGHERGAGGNKPPIRARASERTMSA